MNTPQNAPDPPRNDFDESDESECPERHREPTEHFQSEWRQECENDDKARPE
jgi:hypothetical protein